jgi:hypothetical protein
MKARRVKDSEKGLKWHPQSTTKLMVGMLNIVESEYMITHLDPMQFCCSLLPLMWTYFCALFCVLSIFCPVSETAMLPVVSAWLVG